MSNTLLQRILIKCDNKDVVLSKTILRKTNAYLLGINRRNSVTDMFNTHFVLVGLLMVVEISQK